MIVMYGSLEDFHKCTFSDTIGSYEGNSVGLIDNRMNIAKNTFTVLLVLIDVDIEVFHGAMIQENRKNQNRSIESFSLTFSKNVYNP